MQKKNSITFEHFRGFFDADGTITANIQSNESIVWRFSISQSSANKENLDFLPGLFGDGDISSKQRKTGRNAGTIEYEFEFGPNSIAGKKMRNFFLKSPPLLPSKRRDYRLFEQVFKIQQMQSNRFNNLLSLSLVYQMSNEVSVSTINKRDISLEDRFKQLGVTEKEKVLETTQKIVNSIVDEVNALESALPITLLPNDYIAGFHIGDGGFSVIYIKAPKCKWNMVHFNPRPSWTITDPSDPLLKSFQHTFKAGSISKVGPGEPKNCSQYRLTNIKPCILKVVPVFENLWLSPKKQLQFDKWRQVLILLSKQEHLNELGFKKFLDLSYDLNDNNKRELPKEEYLILQRKWINRFKSKE